MPSSLRNVRFSCWRFWLLTTLSRRSAGPLFGVRSQVDLLRDLEGVVNLNPEVSDCAFKLSVAEQKLAGTQISGLLIDQRHLGAAEAVRAVPRGIETDGLPPLIDEPGILTGANVASGPTSTWK